MYTEDMSPSSVLAKDYFPPADSRYRWHPPGLRHLPWWHHYTFAANDPRKCTLEVNRFAQGFRGMVLFYDTLGNRRQKMTRFYMDPLRAIRVTEELGDAMIAKENRPGWVDEALRLGWRPPARCIVRP